jgi:serine O-acetyltransferase
MTTFRDFVQIVKADLFRYHGATGFKGFLQRYVQAPGFRYTFWMRTAGYLSAHPLLKVPYWIASRWRYHLEVRYGISVDHTTRIGPRLLIDHFGGIVVNEHASIGRNCNLSHGVTIGVKKRGRFEGCPTIGDSVFIGSGAAIIGCVSVGSHVAIGANAVVVDHVADNAVVVGNPARVISMKGSDGYVKWTLET